MTVLTACRPDDLVTPDGDGHLRLSAYKDRMITRTTGTDEYFAEGTRYRIWICKPHTAEPLLDQAGNGVVGTEGERAGDKAPYIDLGDYNKSLSGDIDFYGLTLGTTSVPEQSVVESNYTIQLTKADSSGDFPDYRRGQCTTTGGGTATSDILRMPFRHIMSQVRLVVMREANVKSNLQLVSVTFLGAKKEGNDGGYTDVATSGTYNVYSNQFTLSDNKAQRTVTPQSGDLLIPVVGTGEGQEKDAVEVRTVLAFPETGECLAAGDAADNMHYLCVTFNDPAGFYKKGTSNVVIDIPITDNRVTTGAAPLHFEQNTAYTLCISFLSDQARIVTLVPQVYPWMEGEKTGEDGWQEQDLGQPLTFNGVVWNARNLGAQNAHATDGIDAWCESIGYFYQYGRNIPYFPNDSILDEKGNTVGINLNTPLSVALKTSGVRNGLRPLFPVIRFESWGTSATELNKLQGGLRKYISPTNWADTWMIWKQGKHGDYRQSSASETTWGFAYDYDFTDSKNKENKWYRLRMLSGYENDWAKNTDNTPCPKGWRLPTIADF